MVIVDKAIVGRLYTIRENNEIVAPGSLNSILGLYITRCGNAITYLTMKLLIFTNS
jgi:hypothetical protein